MDIIKELISINYPIFFATLFAVLLGIKYIVSLFEWFIKKLGLETKGMREKREEHELLIKTSQTLNKQKKKHEDDVMQSIAHDKRIQNELSVFMEEMRKSTSETQNDMKQFAINRINDREQSFKIQKELTDSIKNIAELNSIKDKQIDCLMNAQREVLADKINQKYKYYINIKGIPEDELDEFKNLHIAYKECGGNHSGDAKYEYCINHLPVIPVETKLVFNKKD